jgi:hypothetical protein
MIEAYSEPESVGTLYDRLLRHDPMVVTHFMQGDKDQQKNLFLNGEIDAPAHTYPNLETYDAGSHLTQLAELRVEIDGSDEVDTKYKPAYLQLIERYELSHELMRLAQLMQDVPEDARGEFATEYKQKNNELYGRLDRDAYLGMLQKDYRNIHFAEDDATATQLYKELTDMFPAELGQNEVDYTQKLGLPSEETLQTVGAAAKLLYEPLLTHIKDDKTYTAEEVKDVFVEILDDEFGDAAADWNVVLDENSSGIRVVAGKKTIYMPAKRAEMTAERLQGLVAHELGVHFMRALRGGETDMLAAQVGFSNYYDAEEGLGMVMQQAVKGVVDVVGKNAYQVIGYMQDGHNFRETFEMLWRLKALSGTTAEARLDTSAIDKAKNSAYINLVRITRGTDTLPLYKDLAYFNGTQTSWKYFETYGDDEFMLNLASLGKIDQSNPQHRATMLETRTI